MTVYFVRKDGHSDGPYDREEIDEFLERGELRFDDYVWTRGWAEWRKVGDVYPDYALELPGGEILTEEFRKLLERAASWSSIGKRGNPVLLARSQNVGYGIAAWACAQAEDRFRDLIKAALQLIKCDSPPDQLQFRTEMRALGFDVIQAIDALGFLKRHQLVRDPGTACEPLALGVRGEMYTFDELVEQYASPPCVYVKEIPPAERANYTGDRRCVDGEGMLLYVVTSKGRITGSDGTVLGTVMANGDVWDANRQLIARRGDAGVLLRLAGRSD